MVKYVSQVAGHESADDPISAGRGPEYQPKQPNPKH